MATVASINRRKHSPERVRTIDSLLALRASQQARVGELAELYRASTSDDERSEIIAIVYEILFPGADITTAIPIDCDEPFENANLVIFFTGTISPSKSEETPST